MVERFGHILQKSVQRDIPLCLVRFIERGSDYILTWQGPSSDSGMFIYLLLNKYFQTLDAKYSLYWTWDLIFSKLSTIINVGSNCPQKRKFSHFEKKTTTFLWSEPLAKDDKKYMHIYPLRMYGTLTRLVKEAHLKTRRKPVYLILRSLLCVWTKRKATLTMRSYFKLLWIMRFKAEGPHICFSSRKVRQSLLHDLRLPEYVSLMVFQLSKKAT